MYGTINNASTSKMYRLMISLTLKELAKPLREVNSSIKKSHCGD
jgi:hypothetical protein